MPDQDNSPVWVKWEKAAQRNHEPAFTGRESLEGGAVGSAA